MPHKNTKDKTDTVVDLNMVTPDALLTCLNYLSGEAKLAGYPLTAHMIDVAAETLVADDVAVAAVPVDSDNVVKLPV